MDAKSLKVLLKLKEQIDMVASCEERRLLPDFCVIVIKFISRELVSKLLEILCLLFFIEGTAFLFSATSHSCISVLISLLPLVLTLGVCFLIDDSLSSLELLLDFFVRGESALHPRMGKNLFEFRSVGRVQGHHLLEEVLELSRVDIFTLFSILVSLPEDFAAISSQKAVMWISWIGTAEWWSLGQNYEENDS